MGLPVHASSLNGISVTPAVMRIDLSSDSSVAELLYTNNSQEPVTLHLDVKNFSALEDGWTVQFSNQPNSQNFRYSLSSWIKFDSTNVVLAPGEHRTIKVYIDKNGLPSGGHYASIQATIESADEQGSLGIRGALSSLLFVRGASGKQTESGTIQKITMNSQHYSFPSSIELTFNNTGNVETVPYGECTVSQRGNKMVAKAIMNEDSLITLPETVRTYTLPIRKLSSTLFPGTYFLNCSLHLDKDTNQITYTRSFFSLGTFSVSECIYALLFCIGIIALTYRVIRR